jgi:hypothetical protein
MLWQEATMKVSKQIVSHKPGGENYKPQVSVSADIGMVNLCSVHDQTAWL